MKTADALIFFYKTKFHNSFIFSVGIISTLISVFLLKIIELIDNIFVLT